jgi:DNA polymerase elongation subunit (family B)
MVEYFTEKRFEQKQLFNNTGDKYYDDLQSASKIFINSSYGTLGTEGLNFNDFQMADKITGIGRQVIRTCLKWANNKDINYFLPDYDFNKDILYNDILPKSEVIENLKIIGGDTDSVFFCKNDMSFISNEETKMYLTNINKILPPHINMDDDGTYDSFVILKAKNYIMKWNENNEIKYKFKGSSMTDSKKEKALIEMINNIGYSLCEGIKHDNLVKIYNRYIKEACKVSDIQRWVVKKTISKAILNCENDESRKNEQKVYNAIQHLNYQEGDKIYVYDAQDGMIQEYKKGIPVFLKDGSPKMIPNYILKTIDMYNSDYIPEKLMKRVYDTLKIFKTVINFDNFINFNLVKNQHLINDIINN